MSDVKTIETEDEVEASRAPLMDHLLELRSRLIKCVLALVIGCIACIPFLKYIIQGLMLPFEKALVRYNARQLEKGLDASGLELISTAPLEFFFVKMKIALLAVLSSLFLSLLIRFTGLLRRAFTRMSVAHFCLI